MEQYFSKEIGDDFASNIQALKGRVRSKGFDPGNCTYGVEGNTLRAFRGYEQPSKTYQKWASRTTKELLSKVPDIFDQESFDQWHSDLFDSLKSAWAKDQLKQLSYAHTLKLVDLYLKWLCSNTTCPEPLSNSLITFGYCALDSQILRKLNEALSMALPIQNPSMGHIHNEFTYTYCQSLIKAFAEHFGGTRLLFDFYAWEPGKGK